MALDLALLWCTAQGQRVGPIPTTRARLAVDGLSRPFADGQIAAVATVNARILVTHNVGDFKGFDGLTVEDWLQPSSV